MADAAFAEAVLCLPRSIQRFCSCMMLLWSSPGNSGGRCLSEPASYSTRSKESFIGCWSWVCGPLPLAWWWLCMVSGSRT